MKVPLGQMVRACRVLLRMRRRLPTFVSFNVTNRCNERCLMCSVWKTPGRELTLSEMEKIFTGLKRHGIMVIEVSGGEPFLREDIFDVLGMLDRLGLLFTVTSNGTVLPEKAEEKLNRLKGLLQLGVSLDSLDRDMYAKLRGADALPKALRAIEHLSRSKLTFPLKLNFTMSGMNCRETCEVLDFARQRGLYLSVYPVNVGSGFAHRSDDRSLLPGESERREMADVFRALSRLRRNGEPLWEYSRFYDLAAEYVMGRSLVRCDAGMLYLDLHADGTLAPCVDLEGFADLLSEDVASAFRRIESQKEKIEACAVSSPCCYTCTVNLSVTADHIGDFIIETLRVRGMIPFRRRSTLQRMGTGTPASPRSAGMSTGLGGE